MKTIAKPAWLDAGTGISFFSTQKLGVLLGLYTCDGVTSGEWRNPAYLRSQRTFNIFIKNSHCQSAQQRIFGIWKMIDNTFRLQVIIEELEGNLPKVKIKLIKNKLKK